MRQPKLSDLKMDQKGTNKIRSDLGRAKKVKITINIDEDSLILLRTMAAKTGTPYQRLLNYVLKEALADERQHESRIERIERELEFLKKKVAA